MPKLFTPNSKQLIFELFSWWSAHFSGLTSCLRTHKIYFITIFCNSMAFDIYESRLTVTHQNKQIYIHVHTYKYESQIQTKENVISILTIKVDNPYTQFNFFYVFIAFYLLHRATLETATTTELGLTNRYVCMYLWDSNEFRTEA